MFFMKPSPQTLRIRDLAEACRQLHEHRKHLEYYRATTGMYEDRVARLQEEIDAETAFEAREREQKAAVAQAHQDRIARAVAGGLARG